MKIHEIGTLCCVVLCCVVLACTVLYCTVLCCAVLCCAVLCCTVLYCGQFHQVSVFRSSKPLKLKITFRSINGCEDNLLLNIWWSNLYVLVLSPSYLDLDWGFMSTSTHIGSVNLPSREIHSRLPHIRQLEDLWIKSYHKLHRRVVSWRGQFSQVWCPCGCDVMFIVCNNAITYSGSIRFDCPNTSLNSRPTDKHTGE